jgi:hypothetical protein
VLGDVARVSKLYAVLGRASYPKNPPVHKRKSDEQQARQGTWKTLTAGLGGTPAIYSRGWPDSVHESGHREVEFRVLKVDQHGV